jgi:hypothetical protein
LIISNQGCQLAKNHQKGFQGVQQVLMAVHENIIEIASLLGIMHLPEEFLEQEVLPIA